MTLLWTFILVFVLLFLAIGIVFTNKVMYIRKKTDEEILEREAGTYYDVEEYDALPKDMVLIQSPFGYSIDGLYIPNNSKACMIFCHGVTVNKINSIKYANLFHKRGFNILLYDHRRHGKTGGMTTSYGYYEKQDLKAVVDYVKQRFSPDIIGIHGESMGAATLLQYAGSVEDGADFYIADCPFSDFYEQLAYRLHVEFHLPKWPILNIATLFLRWREGYRIKDVSPITYIQNIAHPILFIHSKEDDYILPSMTEELYEKKQGPKQLFLAEEGTHALSYGKNKEAYEEALDSFLQNYVFHENNISL